MDRPQDSDQLVSGDRVIVRSPGRRRGSDRYHAGTLIGQVTKDEDGIWTVELDNGHDITARRSTLLKAYDL